MEGDNTVTDTSVEATATSEATATIKAKYIHLVAILNACAIPCKTIEALDGLTLAREVFMQEEKYEALKEMLPTLKQHFSSSYLTALQATADSKQKWPLLNLIRQLLRACNYKLTPKRVADGYTLAGEKKYKRMFVIEKMKL